VESLRIAHFSNLYLNYYFEDLHIPPDVAKKIVKSVKLRFIETMDNLTNKNIDTIVFSGNTLYFDNMLPKDVREFDSILKKFGRKVYIVPGSIDPYSLYSKFRFSDNVVIFEEDKITKDKLDDSIYFYGIGGKLKSLDLINSIATSRSAINIFCSFLPDFDSSNLTDFDNFNYFAMGGTDSDFSNQNLYFPGSFSVYDWNTGSSSYFVSYISRKENSVSKHFSNTPKFYSMTVNFSKKINIVEHLKSVLLKEEYKESILRLYLEGRSFDFIDIDELSEQIKDYFSYIEIINKLVPDKRSLKKLEASFANLVEDRNLLYGGIQFLRGKGDY
jgi:hypothetical protein